MNKKLQFKLICIDIDGTLIDDNKFIPTFTFKEVQRIQKEYNVKVVLVSSRMPKSLSLLMEDIGFDGPLIAYNGGLILKNYYKNSDDILETTPLPLDTPRLFLKLIDNFFNQLHIGIFYDDNWFVKEIDYWALREIRGTKVWPEVVDLKSLVNRILLEDIAVHKITIRSEKKVLDEVESILKTDLDDTCITFRTNNTYIEISPSIVSKLHAVKRIQSYLSIPNNETIAFGDNINDLEMLTYVGHGVAMGNSPTSIKKVCKEVTLSNNEDGVGYILRKYFPL